MSSVALLCAVAPAGADSTTRTAAVVKGEDAGFTVHIPRGRTVEVELKENPSSGAVWTTLAGASPGTVLVQTGAKFVPNETQLPGGEGTQTLLYSATRVGTTTLVVGEHSARATYFTTDKFVIVVSKSTRVRVSTRKANIAATRYPVVTPKRKTKS
jgi:predicted secreted protein